MSMQNIRFRSKSPTTNYKEDLFCGTTQLLGSAITTVGFIKIINKFTRFIYFIILNIKFVFSCKKNPPTSVDCHGSCMFLLLQIIDVHESQRSSCGD